MFVEIQDRIIDTKKIQREQILLKRIIEHEISQTLKKYGFRKKGKIFLCDENLLVYSFSLRASYRQNIYK